MHLRPSFVALLSAAGLLWAGRFWLWVAESADFGYEPAALLVGNIATCVTIATMMVALTIGPMRERPWPALHLRTRIVRWLQRRQLVTVPERARVVDVQIEERVPATLGAVLIPVGRSGDTAEIRRPDTLTARAAGQMYRLVIAEVEKRRRVP